jgi:hypothetical protein
VQQRLLPNATQPPRTNPAPAAAQYADSAALVSPVDAQPTALMLPGRSLRMRLTCGTTQQHIWQQQQQ